MTKINPYQCCFNLYFHDKLKSFLPAAYIVNHADAIDYLDKLATPEIILGYGIDYEAMDENIKKLLSICEKLRPELIFKRYSKNIKTAKNLDDLLKDSKLYYGISQFLNSNLQVFLEIINTNNFPLSINISKDKDFINYQISTNNPVLKPKLQFDKTENGVQYSLLLQENETVFEPYNHKIDLVYDEPSWIVLDKKLYQVEALNSKKIIPFLTKKSIFYEAKLIPQLFGKFIADIVKKVDIEATGFEIIQKNEIKNCFITAEFDFFEKTYFLNLLFDYNGYIFDNLKSKMIHSQIDITDLENIKVIQCKRNIDEQIFEKKLEQLGFSKTENGVFKPAIISKTDEYETVQWLIDNKKNIQSLGFSLENLKINGKKIITEIAVIQQTSALKKDWFDVAMTVVCGNFQFNFIDLILNIKTENRIYQLSDGTIFLIPNTWFTTYSTLLKLSKLENGVFKLPKSNFSVLENPTGLNPTQNQNHKIEFSVSNLVKAELRPYQIEGVKWLLEHFNNQFGAILADDMGLGKTLQTLAVLVAVQEQLENLSRENVQADLFANETITKKEFLKTLIVLPSSLIFNWNNEARKFTPHFQKIQYIGNDRKKISNKLDQYDLIFTSYSILTRDISVFEKYNFRYLILDESQYIKNKNSKIFKAISQIQADNKISLSGTPIENSLDDLWSQMEFINPNILGNYNFFNVNYKIPIQKKHDDIALAELKKIISPFILRRTKEQVLKDLPPLIEQVFYCAMEPDQEKLYEEEKSKTRNFLLNNQQEKIHKFNILKSLQDLRMLSNHPKMIDQNSEMDSGKYIAVINYLQSLILANKKTIVFSSFVSNLVFYEKWCKENQIEYCILTGKTSLNDREIAVNKFQNHDTPLLFFISLKAGGVGLNITKASFVLFLDPWWNPFAEKQGISRAHRMGQENTVTVVRFISKNTIEEKILTLQENKKLLSNSLLDNDSINVEIEENLDYILS